MVSELTRFGDGSRPALVAQRQSDILSRSHQSWVFTRSRPILLHDAYTSATSLARRQRHRPGFSPTGCVPPAIQSSPNWGGLEKVKALDSSTGGMVVCYNPYEPTDRRHRSPKIVGNQNFKSTTPTHEDRSHVPRHRQYDPKARASLLQRDRACHAPATDRSPQPFGSGIYPPPHPRPVPDLLLVYYSNLSGLSALHFSSGRLRIGSVLPQPHQLRRYRLHLLRSETVQFSSWWSCHVGIPWIWQWRPR